MTANTIIAAAALTPATPPRKNNLIPKLTITSISLLFSIALLILLLHFYVRRHVIRRARRLRPPTPASAARSPAVPSAVLNSLPVLLFSGEPKECSVCLNEFEDGEKIRCLPRCGHSFHIQCIDMWFGSHSSCPLCRAVVEEVAGEVDLCCCCRREEVVEIPAAEEVVVIDIPAGLAEEEIQEGGNLNWRRARVLSLIWRSLMLGIWGKRVDGVATETGPLPASLPEGPAE